MTAKSVAPLPQMGGVPGYDDLERVLCLAYDQCARGKGKERHASDRTFMEQPINTIPQSKNFLVGLGGLSYQVEKKSGETDRMCERAFAIFSDKEEDFDLSVKLGVEKLEAALRESLGVIVYAAAKYLHIEREMKRRTQNSDSYVPPSK